tara:strand:+ start:667 stop:864 length:198 start_codon:yes stop_codon:yes gene_type:complete
MNKDTITMIAKVTNESYTNGISKGRLEAYNQIIAYLDGHFEGKITAAIRNVKHQVNEWIENEKTN